MVVPEPPEDIRALKEAVGAFVEREVYPLEKRIAERGSIDEAEVDDLRRKSHDAGFSMLNMPAEIGRRALSMLGQVALEEESGKATNGLGFAVVDRGPRELYEIATREQVERYVVPIVRGDYREAWALTEPVAGSDLSGLRATAVRDGDEWVLNGEKWFATGEAAHCCGAALRLVDLTATGRRNVAFGEPIAEYPGISFPLADSLTELHAARLLTYHAAHAFDTLSDRKVVQGRQCVR